MDRRASSLIQRMLQGDPASCDEVIRLYSGEIYRLGYSLLWSREEAEDVLQESMLRLIAEVRHNRLRAANGSIRGFLRTTARNLCIDRLRKQDHFYSRTDEIRSVEEATRVNKKPDQVAEENSARDAFRNALGDLTDIQRTVLVLHDLNEESVSEIAETLGLSANHVCVHLCRARRKMRLLLAPFMEESR